jgi:NTE family protein
MTKRIGVVLGAGGSTGHGFHAGVLAALADEIGFDARDADAIVGTSAGSIIGTLLRAGLAPADLQADVLGESRASPPRAGAHRGEEAAVPSQPAPRRGAGPAAPRLAARALITPWAFRYGTVLAGLLPEGSIDTEIFAGRLRSLVPAQWPNDPLWLCTVRLDDGRRVVFGRDDAPLVDPVTAVRASCAIPGFFAPVTIEGARYVDGGAHSPTNLDLMAGLSLDLVVVSSPMSFAGIAPPLGFDGPSRALARAALWREAGRVRRSGTPVLAFEPTPRDRSAMGMNPMDSTRREATATQVYESTRRRLAARDAQELFSSSAPRHPAARGQA